MKKGRAYNSGSFLLKVSDSLNNNGITGAFISTKKNFPLAVDRNKTRRILREAFIEAIKNQNNVNIPYFVFLSKKETIKIDFASIVEDIKQIIFKNYIIKQ